MERSKMGTKKRNPDGLSLPIQNTIKIYINKKEPRFSVCPSVAPFDN